MTDSKKERRKHTPDSVMEELMTCKTEVGIQVENLRGSFQEHKDDFKILADDWETFKKEFAEMLKIFRSAKGFFTVLGWIAVAAKWTMIFGAAVAAVWILITTGHWPGLGE